MVFTSSFSLVPPSQDSLSFRASTATGPRETYKVNGNGPFYHCILFEILFYPVNEHSLNLNPDHESLKIPQIAPNLEEKHIRLWPSLIQKQSMNRCLHGLRATYKDHSALPLTDHALSEQVLRYPSSVTCLRSSGQRMNKLALPLCCTARESSSVRRNMSVSARLLSRKGQVVWSFLSCKTARRTWKVYGPRILVCELLTSFRLRQMLTAKSCCCGCDTNYH